MTAQALPKISELTDKIHSYTAKNRKTSDLDIRRLKKETENLRSKVPENDYFDFLGRIACLENDLVSLDKYYQTAIKLAPNDFQTQNNYVFALNKAGYDSKALAYIKTMLTNFPTRSEEIIPQMIDSAIFSCRLHEAFDYLNKLQNSKNHESYQIIKASRAIFEAAELQDDEAEQLQNLAFSILRDRKLYYSSSEMNIINDFIHYEIYVDLPIQQIPELDFALSLKFAETLVNMRDDVIVFEYKSVDTLKL